MSTRKTHDIVATTGTYKDRDGSEKKRYSTVGSLFQDAETGRLSIKLDTVPVSPDWSGWLACMEPRNREVGGGGSGGKSAGGERSSERNGPPRRQDVRTQASIHPATQMPLDEDDIPF